MSAAVEWDLWIHTNDVGRRSVPAGHAQTLAVVGSAVRFAVPAAFYLRWGIHKGKLTLTANTTNLLGSPATQSTSLRGCTSVGECVCMREIKGINIDKGRIVIKKYCFVTSSFQQQALYSTLTSYTMQRILIQ